jgi:hypothetical protein
MKLTLKPVEVPFMVGDLVWVAQPAGKTNPQPYFQGQVMQIILDGSLKHTVVVRQRKEVHELLISNAIYDLKPVGDHAGVARISVDVELFADDKTLFATKEELLASQAQPDVAA